MPYMRQVIPQRAQWVTGSSCITLRKMFWYRHTHVHQKKLKTNCDLVLLIRIILWLPTRGGWGLFINGKTWKNWSSIFQLYEVIFLSLLGRIKHNPCFSSESHILFPDEQPLSFFHEERGIFSNNDATKLKGKKVAQKVFLPPNTGSNICQSWKSFKTPVWYFWTESANGILHHIRLNL